MRRQYPSVLWIFLTLSLAFVQYTYAQAPNEPLYINLSKTLGFIMGQQLSLNRIKAEYPTLSSLSQKAELEFKFTFGNTEKNIEKKLREIFKEKYPEYIAVMEKRLESNIKSQQITQDIAEQFLNEVESRAKGNIPSPFLETLLNYQFEERPVEEFNRGFKKKYSTEGHHKAKGLNIQIEYPKSWSIREGNRPNIIQFFTSNNGNGLASASIMVRDMLKGLQEGLTSEEIKFLMTREGSNELAAETFSEISLKKMANGMGMTDVRELTTKRVVLDNWPGAMLEFIGDKQRLDFTLTMYNRSYIVIYKNYMIFLQCQVGEIPNETEDALKIRISKFSSLFHQMANSLVIQNQY